MEVLTVLRNILLSESDRLAIAVSKLSVITEEVIANYIKADMPRYPYVAHTTKFSLPDITINIDGFDVAWIESIVIVPKESQLEIGHFALDKKLVGLGIGKRLAFALQKVAREQLAITQILFKERSENSKYPPFFEKTLGATKVPGFPTGDNWLWNFA